MDTSLLGPEVAQKELRLYLDVLDRRLRQERANIFQDKAPEGPGPEYLSRIAVQEPGLFQSLMASHPEFKEILQGFGA